MWPPRGPRGSRPRSDQPTDRERSPGSRPPSVGAGESEHRNRGRYPRRSPRQHQAAQQQQQPRPTSLMRPPRLHLQAGPGLPKSRTAHPLCRPPANRPLRASEAATTEK
ncbi:hypothetical protein NDU88_003660 [Pleurodeles waltl]|uniref:Uncharacterized protein n=1 Tax=Pleurodeles waltl TaxID=8319 RepID=A0AAV7MRS6_PLEWA|nr:hypothetical protein NDU88_003660 [Pleurodeles waltl]